MSISSGTPIFPLRSIVLPGGFFPLRIFERRYLDMVKEDAPNSYVTEIYEYGSWVRIYDWNQLNDGLLGITTEGLNIVKISNTSLDSSNLLRGKIEKLESEKEYLIPQKYTTLSKFYKKIYPSIQTFIHYKEERFADASWVGYRLTECLPIDLETKCDLIKTSNAIERLEKISKIMENLYEKEFKGL